jgi:processive 1,2-diacylglycerol beta-glucosyltransferase
LTSARPRGDARRMPRLYRLDNGETIGTITDKQLQFLVDQLEEESEDDNDYFIDRDTLELLSDNGIDPDLLAMIEKAMGDDDEIDVAWE